MKHMFLAAFVWLAVPVYALDDVTADDLKLMSDPFVARLTSADVVVLGEVHDNVHHHDAQAVFTEWVKPAAIVFEMLTTKQVAQISDANRSDEAALAEAIGWDQTGWPVFSMYFQIFAAAPGARIYGAGLPRGVAQEALEAGVADFFGEDAVRYGLDQPLSGDGQAARLEMQRAAHCGALPDVMLPMMVDLQRLRDAMLARAVVTALADTGGPVVVITGNGHARKDWGLAIYLEQAQHGLTVFALGQSEDGQIDGAFDGVLDSLGMDRADPCLAFEKK